MVKYCIHFPQALVKPGVKKESISLSSSLFPYPKNSLSTRQGITNITLPVLLPIPQHSDRPPPAAPPFPLLFSSLSLFAPARKTEPSFLLLLRRRRSTLRIFTPLLPSSPPLLPPPHTRRSGSSSNDSVVQRCSERPQGRSSKESAQSVSFYGRGLRCGVKRQKEKLEAARHDF